MVWAMDHLVCTVHQNLASRKASASKLTSHPTYLLSWLCLNSLMCFFPALQRKWKSCVTVQDLCQNVKQCHHADISPGQAYDHAFAMVKSMRSSVN